MQIKRLVQGSSLGGAAYALSSDVMSAEQFQEFQDLSTVLRQLFYVMNNINNHLRIIRKQLTNKSVPGL